MDICAAFSENFPTVPVEKNFSFARHTCIGCGGVAALAISPANKVDFVYALRYLEANKIPYTLLGAGANVLPPDGFYDGVVVRFSRLNRISHTGKLVYAEGGVTGGSLLRYCKKNGLGGLEHFTGIPMTVGGGIAMNAGVKDGHFSDVVCGVEGIEGGKINLYSLRECDFGEKQSVFLRGIAVIGAYLQCKDAAPSESESRLSEYREKRKSLPKGRSMGCVFVNPEGVTAGELIERCGLKNYSVGGARVSEKHANFILNEGGTVSDVSDLIDYIKQTVFTKTGILLREEIRRISP